MRWLGERRTRSGQRGGPPGERGDSEVVRGPRRAQRVFGAAVAAAVLMSLGGFIGAAWVKSPAELAAETKPPKPSLLTAAATRQQVRSTIVTRGTVRARRKIEATPRSEHGAERLVVSSVAKPAGSKIEAGDVILAVSGRPLFALQGSIPSYRDLGPGDSGSDVAQLQKALGDVGYSVGGDEPGYYSAGTTAAVDAFYDAIGYPSVHAGASAAQLAAAHDRVTRAREALGAAHGEASRHAAHVALDRTERSYDQLAAHSGAMLPMDEVVYVPSFPASVLKLGARDGETVKSPLVTLDAGGLDVAVRLDPSDKGMVKAGMAVRIEDEVTGFRGHGKVARVGAVTTGHGGAALPVTVNASSPLPSKLAGQDVRVTIVYAHSHGRVLAVPEAAVNASADGSTYVVRVGPGGRQVRVPVRAGLSGGGVVEVTPLSGTLQSGDRVVTGT